MVTAKIAITGLIIAAAGTTACGTIPSSSILTDRPDKVVGSVDYNAGTSWSHVARYELRAGESSSPIRASQHGSSTGGLASDGTLRLSAIYSTGSIGVLASAESEGEFAEIGVASVVDVFRNRIAFVTPLNRPLHGRYECTFSGTGETLQVGANEKKTFRQSEVDKVEVRLGQFLSIEVKYGDSSVYLRTLADSPRAYLGVDLTAFMKTFLGSVTCQSL